MAQCEAYRLGILGGSFNPIHNAHLAMAQSAMGACDLDRVLFLPAGNPPHKRSGLADKWDRLRMTELAVEGYPRFAACDLEVRREGITYTVDTLRDLRGRWPGASLWYIVGADTLMELHTWLEADEVFALTHFIVCTRPGWREEAEEECANQLRARGAAIWILRTPGIDISSTKIRQSLEQDGTVAQAFMPPEVWSYLRSHRLYG